VRSNRTSRTIALAYLVALSAVIVLAFAAAPIITAQPQTKPAATAVQLDVAPGTSVSYLVREQLAGINFPDDAEGKTDAITGSISILPDGSIDTAKSKLVIDLREIKSDQDMRDNYVRTQTFQTDKFPNAEFVPRELKGVPSPIPAPDRATGQSGFQLIGDLTVHGITKPVTLDGYATYSKDLISGRAITNFTFATFGLPKPTLARLLSVDDKIQLVIAFRLKRS
jgi:polyisoprenoid-binding protein YceI